MNKTADKPILLNAQERFTKTTMDFIIENGITTKQLKKVIKKLQSNG